MTGVGLAAGGLVAIGWVVVGEFTYRRRLAAVVAAPLPRRVNAPRSLRLPPLAQTGTLAAIAGALATGAVVALASGQVALGIVAAAVVGLATAAVPRRRRRAEREMLRTQMADAIASLAASMRAGHTFARGLQELLEGTPAPLGPHLERVVADAELGVPNASAVAAMARRTGLAEAHWLAHVLALQERTGCSIAPLLSQLAELIRQNDGLRREVSALTAEGRMGAYVIAGLPVLLVATLEVMHPGYLEPFSQGWGVVLTVLLVASVLAGLGVMQKMVNSIEV